MPDSLSSLEARRAELLRSIADLNDMRLAPSSVPFGAVENRLPLCTTRTTPVMAELAPYLQASRQDLLLRLAEPGAVRKAEQEIAEFRNYNN